MSDNNAGHKKPDWWWEAQFRLYGISFKDGDDMRGVAMWALKEGLFNSPSDEMKALETRLVEEFRVNKHKFVQELIAYCKEKACRAADEEERNGSRHERG
ncbi:hypothetical protein F4825DRAFT_424821 [Nemania diffusa]|nr:hypothetical protein F4825DRAFT_424821 [Nemania diffusa]